jgi:uncharacterized protein (TIGR03437 family)
MRRLTLLFLLAAPFCFGYVPLLTLDATPLALHRNDNANIQLLINNQIAPGLQSSASGSPVTIFPAGSDPAGAIRNAIATWNAVSAANINFLQPGTTSAGHNPSDNQMVVLVASSANDISAVSGALAVTLNAWVAGSSVISDSDILLNPATAYSMDGSTRADLQAVMTHEFGHSLGDNHNGLLGSTMFQFAQANQRTLSSDELTFAASLYPSTVNPPSFGTISGKVSTSGGSGVPYALLTLIDTTGNNTLSGLTRGDGTFAVKVPPGLYEIYAEPINEVLPIIVYLTPSQTAQAGSFLPTWFTGTFRVTANASATANVTVTSGISPLAVPYVGVGGAGQNGDVTSFFQVVGSTQINSGQSVDLAIAGAGLDKTLTDANVRVYGPGIWIRPGSVRADTLVNINLGQGLIPIIRITLDIAARQTKGLASIFITKGGNTLSLSGFLTINPPSGTSVNTPPTPVTTLQGFVNAASGLGNGTVSPGEYAVIYGNNLSPTGGPVYGGFQNNGFDGAQVLPTNFADVTVTFDGVPAPLFFVSSGQINLQVPFEVAGKATTQVVVNYLGSSSAPVAVPVVSIQPALFIFPIPTAAYTGNQDYTVNSASNAAPRGSYVTVYGTGVGLPGYPIQTGVGAAPSSASLNANGYTCTVGGISTPVLYAGWTPTQVALAQFNVQIPNNAPVGAVPIVFTNGANSTQATLTLSVK